MECKNCQTEMNHKGLLENRETRPGVFANFKLPPFECPGCSTVVYWTTEYQVPGWGLVAWDIVSTDDGQYEGDSYDFRADEGGWVPATGRTERYPSIKQVQAAIDNARQWDQEDQFDPSKGGLAW